MPRSARPRKNAQQQLLILIGMYTDTKTNQREEQGYVAILISGSYDHTHPVV